jgi:hypothetical protein
LKIFTIFGSIRKKRVFKRIVLLVVKRDAFVIRLDGPHRIDKDGRNTVHGNRDQRSGFTG